jgi:fatty acid desaturase
MNSTTGVDLMEPMLSPSGPAPGALMEPAPEHVGLSRQTEVQALALHEIVLALRARKMSIYWIDFLASAGAGYLAFALFPLDRPLSIRAGALLVVATLALYRAAVFTHEIAHMPRRKYVAFRLVWNMLCGIPLLIPSFMYEMHYEHHSPQKYGSAEDGEYLSFARLPRAAAAGFILASFLAAPALVFRFLLLAPLRWIYTPLNQFVFTRASSLAIDGEYRRSWKPGAIPREWLFQEVACWVWCLVAVALAFGRVVSLGRWVEAYAVVSAVVLVNAVRVLAAHRYQGDGEPMSFAEQIQDSNDFLSPVAELWAPVGLRYHAIHHLLPQLPYHCLPEARRRLVSCAEMRQRLSGTSRSSLFSVLRELLKPRTRVD